MGPSAAIVVQKMACAPYPYHTASMARAALKDRRVLMTETMGQGEQQAETAGALAIIIYIMAIAVPG